MGSNPFGYAISYCKYLIFYNSCFRNCTTLLGETVEWYSFMIKNQARLFRRNHTYYIRVSIPNDLKNIIKKKEIKYSLKTNDYFESLKLLR